MRFILEHISIFTGVNDRQTRRKDLEKDVFEPLGDYMIRRAYRMDKDTFYVLHEILEPHLQDHFFPAKGGSRDPKKDSYLIKTEIRLAVAIRYFAGGSPLDIMLIHGVSFYSVFLLFGELLIVLTNVLNLISIFLLKKSNLKFLTVINKRVEHYLNM